MFGFLKGKSKGKQNPDNGDCKGNTHNKDKQKGNRRSRKHRHLFDGDKKNDCKEAIRTDHEPISETQSISEEDGSKSQRNGHYKHSSESNNWKSCENTPSSSCHDSYEVSNSSSRASIPSITTECNEDNVSLNHDQSEQHSIASEGLSESSKPNALRTTAVSKQDSQQGINTENMRPISNVKNSASKCQNIQAGLALKPPVIPRSYNKLDRCSVNRLNSNDDDDTSIDSSILSLTSSPIIIFDTVNPYFNPAQQFHCEGRNSILSTPSSSTSSLSSASLRPSSPSGRKTPPGPRMGTSVKLGSSPTPSRKFQRTNIKTNPNTAPGIPKAGLALSLAQSSKDNVIFSINKTGVSQFNETAVKSDKVEYPKVVPVNVSRNSFSLINPLDSIPEHCHDSKQLQQADGSLNRTAYRKDMNTEEENNSHVPKLDLSKEDIESSDEISELPGHGSSVAKNSQYISEALNALSKTIAQEKEFTSSILRDLESSKCDDDSSESYREPEVREHKLQLIPNSTGIKNSITVMNENVTSVENITEKKRPLENNTAECEASSNSDPENSTFAAIQNVEPTHGIFRIPLRSKSCSREHTESPKRLSIDREIPETHDDSKNIQEILNDSIHCVEGHVELNFERGRSDQRMPKSTRHRSTSALRRQKLYDDIKKFSAETKECQVKGNFRRGERQQGDCRRSQSCTRYRQALSCTENNLKEVSKQLWGEDGKSRATKKHTLQNTKPDQSSNTCYNTLPLVNPRKFERSITVAEIKFDVKNNTNEIGDSSACKDYQNKLAYDSCQSNETGTISKTTLKSKSLSPVRNKKSLKHSNSYNDLRHESSKRETSTLYKIIQETTSSKHSSGNDNAQSNWTQVVSPSGDSIPNNSEQIDTVSSSNNGLQKLTVSRDEHLKELSALETKYQEQVDKLSHALAEKQEELKNTKTEAERILREREERYSKEKLRLKTQLEEDAKKREEQLRKDERERVLKETAEKSKQNEEEASNRDNELEENRIKFEKLQMELLLMKQQNEEFEEIVREKHRKQMELELQIGEIHKEMREKEAAIERAKAELICAKNETEATKKKLKKLEEELDEYKDKVDKLEADLDNSERELKRMEILQEKLQDTESKRTELQKQLDEIELERDEEIKIIQEALDEAAMEREELLATFEKEMERINSLNTAREAQMLEDFEKKLKELEKEHQQKLKEKEREVESNMNRTKRHDDEETRHRLDRMKSELNSEWEDKCRSECARLKAELDKLHAEEKHLAVESMKVQKEHEMQTLRSSFDSKAADLNKEISTLKESLGAKDSFYRQELDDLRTRADRDVWELRRKLQKLDESAYDRQQLLEDKHREDIERLKEEYKDRIASMESQLSAVDVRGMTDLRANLERVHKEQMEHISEQHRLSMERLREELEAEKFQAAEDARVLVTKHHEYINTNLREQLAEAITANTQLRDEIDAIKFALSRREEVIRSLEEELSNLRSSRGIPTPAPQSNAVGAAASQLYHEDHLGSRNSQDSVDGSEEDGHKGSGLLGKVFGGGWFSGAKAKDNAGGINQSGTPRRGSSTLHRQAW